jgi:hypothetical protein
MGMGFDKALRASCDLCGERTSFDDEKIAKAAGWVEISIPDYHVDRMWHQKVICHRCMKLIVQATDLIKSNSPKFD